MAHAGSWEHCPDLRLYQGVMLHVPQACSQLAPQLHKLIQAVLKHSSSGGHAGLGTCQRMCPCAQSQATPPSPEQGVEQRPQSLGWRQGSAGWPTGTSTAGSGGTTCSTARAPAPTPRAASTGASGTTASGMARGPARTTTGTPTRVRAAGQCTAVRHPASDLLRRWGDHPGTARTALRSILRWMEGRLTPRSPLPSLHVSGSMTGMQRPPGTQLPVFSEHGGAMHFLGGWESPAHQGWAVGNAEAGAHCDQQAVCTCNLQGWAGDSGQDLAPALSF